MKVARIALSFLLLVLLDLIATAQGQALRELIKGSQEQWPMAGGPNGSWTVRTKSSPPTSWSVAANESVIWSTPLPEGGQSGIAVWNDRLFLTCNKPLPKGTLVAKASGTDIVGLCLNSRTGKILWSVPIPGTKPMAHSGLFADNSSPTPITDGRHVWFTNAGGCMACFDMEGRQVWTRPFEARTRHNAKQCEPLMVGDQILHVEMKDKNNPTRREMKAKPFARNSDPSHWPWTFLHSFDARTGTPNWTAQAGTSVHNTPTHRLVNGQAVAFHARGGGHKPPETPYGFSLTSLTGDKAGKTLWDFESRAGYAFFVTHMDDKHAYCFEKNALIVLSLATGKELKRISLVENASILSFDVNATAYRSRTGQFKSKAKKSKPHPTNQANIIVDGYCLFMSFSGHYLARIHIESGRVEYLQVPTQVAYEGTQKLLVWDKHTPSDTKNSRGMDVAPDKRAKGDDWGHVTSASPIAINNLVYFTTMLGTTYVVDAKAKHFDEAALIAVNDSGPAGETWTLSAPSFSAGRIYHRTLKEVVAIGER